MEIDITNFVLNSDPFDYSASVAERGANAGRETWRNAVAEGESAPMLTTEDQLDALRAWARESGGWDEAETAAWSDAECNALFIQIVSGDMREAGLDDCDLEDFDWDAYREDAEQGRISGNIYRGDIEGTPGFGRIFFYLGS